MAPVDKSISQRPYVRARESAVFNGLLKGTDALTSRRNRPRSPISDFERIAASSGSGSSNGSPPVSFSRVPSDVGNQSSGKLVSGEVERSADSSPLESEPIVPDIVLEIKAIRRSSFHHSPNGKEAPSSGFHRSRSVRNDSGYSSKPLSKDIASSGLLRSASYNVNVDSRGSDDSGSESKYLNEETAAAGLPQSNVDSSSTDDSGNESKPMVKTSMSSSAGLPRSGSYDLAGDSSGAIDESKALVKTFEVFKEDHVLSIEGSSILPERLFQLSESKLSPSKAQLPQSAASFYAGFTSQLFQIVESCESMKKVNQYLKARKNDVRAGVPGQFLQAVLGQELSDVGTIASTILYAFYLHETLGNDQFCTVPVINMKREDLGSRAEISWLFGSCQVDESSLIFADEIDLHYYDLFGSLKVVLLNGSKLPAKQEALKGSVIEVFNCRKAESMYPGVQRVTVSENDSCCTLIAEKFMESSLDVLTGAAFSRLLLAGILLDTGNLSAAHTSTKDKYMCSLLIKGAGQYGFNGLYQILRRQKYDVSNQKVIDVLRKDFKKWSRSGLSFQTTLDDSSLKLCSSPMTILLAAKSDSSPSKLLASDIGMSSTGMSMKQLLTNENFSIDAIKYFQELEKLGLLVVVSGYYDSQKNFKREMLIVAETSDVAKSLLEFIDANAPDLPLTPFHPAGLKDEMRALEIDKIISRKTIERVLVEYGGDSYSRCY
ncbi:Exopolyphosphatase PRUNE1 [Linum perenne]